MLNYKLLFQKDNEIENLKDEDIYPGRKNGYSIKLKNIKSPIDSGFNYRFVPIEIYKLSEFLKQNLNQEKIYEILPLLDDIYQLGYDQGVFNETYNG